MTKKILKPSLAFFLALIIGLQASAAAFAAGSKKEYVSEVVLSYGKSDDEAKKWLTDNGYNYVDNNINEGADDKIYMSVKRSVYLGYKTTSDPDEAITDMKLMNMNGGYSVQDYQMILEEEKTDIREFISGFIDVIREYRENYEAGNKRAIAAYDMLNMMYDDDTGMNLGDLFLNKIKEEYEDGEFDKLTEEEQKKHADMTTILMQGSSELVLSVEQILSLAVDSSGSLWIERYKEAETYDEMYDGLVDGGMQPEAAEKELAKKYDDTTAVLVCMAKEYKEWLSDYDEGTVKITDSEEDIEKYTENMSDSEKAIWLTKGSQELILADTALSDGTTLLDLLTGDGYDLDGEDRTMLYPLASVLSDGQKAGLQFIPCYQLISMGINSGDAVENVVEDADVDSEKHAVSVYDGIDRSIYGEDVALTGEAYKMQTSSEGKDYSDGWFTDGLSTTTKILDIVASVSILATIGTAVTMAIFKAKAFDALVQLKIYEVGANHIILQNGRDFYYQGVEIWQSQLSSNFKWYSIFKKAAVGMTVVSIILSGVSLWRTYEDLSDYYHATFTPIPGWMVDQSTDENDAKIFTYYKAVACNRTEGGFVTDNNEILKDFGDINGDVGKQWVALYTTTDEAAGNPIEADFVVKYSSPEIPGEYTPLTIFCEGTAQNLTNEKAGYTYNDSKGGIYLFYNTDASAFAGSAITTGGYVAIAAGIAVVAAGIICLIAVRNKKKKAAAPAEE